MAKLTQEQKMRIYCVKHGHARYVTMFWGYVYCGRCGEQVGDTLASTYPDADKVLVVGCHEKPCKSCDPIRKNLDAKDKAILQKLEKELKAKE